MEHERGISRGWLLALAAVAALALGGCWNVTQTDQDIAWTKGAARCAIDGQSPKAPPIVARGEYGAPVVACGNKEDLVDPDYATWFSWWW